MSQISGRRRLVALLGYATILLIIYAALVVFDVAVNYYLQRIDGTRAATIEKDRACEEDYQQIGEARALGYKSLLYPDLYDRPPYREIAIKYRTAPLASTPDTNLYYCNEGHGQVRYKSDRYGFRNRDALWEEPTIDVLLIGDSYVHGACVGDEQTIAGALISRGLTALNLGTASNSPIHYAAIAREFVKIVPEKIAVIVFYPNDNLDNEEESVFNEMFFENGSQYFERRYHRGTPRVSQNLIDLYRDSSAKLSASNKRIDKERLLSIRECRASRTLYSLITSYQLAFKSHLQLESIYRLFDGFLTVQEAQKLQTELPFGTKLAIDVLQKECHEHGCKPLFVYIPNSDYWRPDSRAKRYSALLKIYLESRGLRLIDMSPALNRLGHSAYAKRGPHLSPKGYRAVADSIADAIGNTVEFR